MGAQCFNKKVFRDLGLFVAGNVLLVSGLTLILVFWPIGLRPEVVIFFKGGGGILLALLGLGVLWLVRD